MLHALSRPPAADTLRHRAGDFSMAKVAGQYLDLLDTHT